MKVLVEIHDEQVVQVLQESIKVCLSSCLPRSLPMKPHHFVDFYNALEYCAAANVVIDHFGGKKVDLPSIGANDV